MVLKYTQMPLNRYSKERKDSSWLYERFLDETARFVIVQSGRNLFDKDFQPAYLERLYVDSIELDNAIFLGIGELGPVFAVDSEFLSKEEREFIETEYHFEDLRKVGPTLTFSDSAILAFGKGLIHWHSTHRFCGRCGYKNISVEAGHSRLCERDECSHRTFPRTDPAVIMIVEHTFADGITRCLLGRQKSWPDGVYSTLAGFVDPGESLEETVIREVKEEAGIDVTDVKYLASQPWPFPSSIMLGFTAKALSAEIHVDLDELDDAKWFTREELSQQGEWGDKRPGYKKTRPDSISRFLVDHWQAGGEKLSKK